MHENEFEKRVQQKMEELNFAPSDAVWKNVDEAINKKEKRWPLFWLFFFLGLVLIGGGIYFLRNQQATKIENLSNLTKQPDNDKLNEPTDKKNEDETPEINKDENSAVTKNKKEEEAKNQDNKNQDNNIQAKKIQGDKNDKEKVLTDAKNGKAKKDNEASGVKKWKSYKEDDNVAIAKTSDKKLFIEKKKSYVINKNEQKDDALKNEGDDDVSEKNIVGEKNASGEEAKIEKDFLTDKKKIDSSMKNVAHDDKNTLSDSLQDKKIAESKIKPQKHSSWKIGFQFIPGFSSVQRELFKSANAYPSNYATNSPSGGLPNPGIGTSSEIKSGFSFAAGVSINKEFSKRLFFSTGLNYHYYSTSITTGKFVDSAAYVSLSGNMLSLTNGYYSSGKEKYVNSYHFLELPLLLDWQINKGNKIPFVWEAGASVSYLLNSDALHFDPTKGIYYKNSSLFNKTQLSASTALMANLRVNKNDFLFGPEVQYGVTRLLKNSTGNTEHLLFVGFKFSYILNKK